MHNSTASAQLTHTHTLAAARCKIKYNIFLYTELNPLKRLWLEFLMAPFSENIQISDTQLFLDILDALSTACVNASEHWANPSNTGCHWVKSNPKHWTARQQC